MPAIPIIGAIITAAGSAVWAAASVVGTVGAAIFGAGAYVGITAAAATVFSGIIGVGILAGINYAVTALTTPKIHARGSPTEFSADPSAGIPYVMGRTGVGGTIVAELTSYGDKNKNLHFVIAYSGAGPIDSFESFSVNDGTAVTFGGTGVATSSPYTGKMGLTSQLGASTDPLLPSPPGFGSVPEWDGAHKMTGYAASRWALQYDPDVYPSVPKPLRVLKGVKVYDPRLDSTYPGGSGSHRIDNESTWAWSENPWLHALTFCIGRRQNGKRVIGLGAPSASIDFPAFVEAANIADANGWTLGGQITSKDDKWQVLQAMAQAGGGQIVRLGAQLSCVVQTPRVSIATITGDDVVGKASIPGTQARRRRINSVLPRYQSEAHGWKMVAADKVTISGYVSTDGDTRTRSVDYPLVTQVDQVAQLARYGIEDTRELGPIVLPCKPYLMGLKAGDVVTVDEPEFGLNGQDLLVLGRQRDLQTGVVTLTCRTETAGKHTAALAETGTAPPTPSLTGVDLLDIAAPLSANWSAAGQTLTASDGSEWPIIAVTGTNGDNLHATELVVETSPVGVGNWSNYGIYPLPLSGRVEIWNVTSGDQYDVGIRYRVRGVLSARLVKSAITAGSFAVSGGSADYTPDAVDWTNISATSSSPAVATTITQTISGITASIEIKPTYTGSGSLYYSVNSGTFTSIASGSSFFVSSGDTIAWRVSATSTTSGTVTVTNVTDSNTTLNTFTYSNTVTTGVTPDPMDWVNLYSGNSWTNSNLTFSGLTSPITLRFDVSESGDPGTVAYRKNSGSYTTYTDGSTLSVSNGDTLNFKLTGGGPNTTIVTNVVNTSDGDALIDSFIAFVITIFI